MFSNFSAGICRTIRFNGRRFRAAAELKRLQDIFVMILYKYVPYEAGQEILAYNSIGFACAS